MSEPLTDEDVAFHERIQAPGDPTQRWIAKIRMVEAENARLQVWKDGWKHDAKAAEAENARMREAMITAIGVLRGWSNQRQRALEILKAALARKGP